MIPRGWGEGQCERWEGENEAAFAIYARLIFTLTNLAIIYILV